MLLQQPRIIALTHLFILIKYACARPRLLISGREALPDDDLLPIESGPEPVLNLNIGTAPYTSDILHDGVASEAFEDLGTAPQVFMQSSEQPLPPKASDDKNRQDQVQPALKKRKPSKDNLIAASEPSDKRAAIFRVRPAGLKYTSNRFVNGQESAHVVSTKCHDVKADVVVESGMRSNADVVVGGLATPSWNPSATNLALLKATESVLVFVIHLGVGAVLAAPNLEVSNTDILAVQFVEKDDSDDSQSPDESQRPPVVFIAQHFCKHPGIVRVSVELPLVPEQSLGLHSGERLCPEPSGPVVFSYMKACDAQSVELNANEGRSLESVVSNHAAKAMWKQAAEADNQGVVDLVSKQDSSHKATPWSGIIPRGGVRMFFIAFLIIVSIVAIFEFATLAINQRLKGTLDEIGPDVFGVKTSIGNVSISFQGGHFIYLVEDWVFHNPEGNYEGPYLMHIEKVRVWVNLSKMLCTCCRQVEVVSLIIDGLHAEVEVDGYLMGQPNVQIVLNKLEENNKQFEQDLNKMKADLQDTGIDPHQVKANIEAHIQNILSRLVLKEVFISGITYHLSSKLGGLRLQLADMEFHDFTEHHNRAGRDAVGAENIAYYLGQEIFASLAKDISGVEDGHSRFGNMVSSMKGWVGR